jgi:hypothetical protein
MEKQSRVKSQITDKVYEVSLDDLDEADNEFESELYRINVFGKNIIIAPGKPIKDPRIQGLVYFYVYVIKNEKAIAKLGVYEITTSKNEEIYDLTTFPDGGLLMFDLYYNKPLLITEFEEVEKTNKPAEGNIFDYLAKKYVLTEANVVSKIKEQKRKITSIKISIGTYYKETPKIGEEYKKLLDVFKDRIIDVALLKTLKTTEPDNVMFILYILQLFLNVRFIYIDIDNKILNDAEFNYIKLLKPNLTDIIVVRLGQSPTLVKVYEPDTPRELIEQEIIELSPHEEPKEDEPNEDEPEPNEDEPEPNEDELDELGELKTIKPSNKRANVPLGTPMNYKPPLEPLQPISESTTYSPHTPEGIWPNQIKSRLGSVPSGSVPSGSVPSGSVPSGSMPYSKPPIVYSPHSPPGIYEPLTQPNLPLNNEQSNEGLPLNNESLNEGLPLNNESPNQGLNLNNESVNSNNSEPGSLIKFNAKGGQLKMKKLKK